MYAICKWRTKEVDMIELRGKYNSAKVFTDNVESTAISQIINLLNQPFVDKANIRIMPDVHAGAGCVIGFTADLGDMVIPNLIGVDISELALDIQALDVFIRSNIPAGFDVHSRKRTGYDEYKKILCYDELRNSERFGLAIGTLGGGNHFIEIDHSQATGKSYLVVHTGSRNMGKQVADYYQKRAIELQGDLYPKDLCFLMGQEKEKYLHDMKLCQEYALENRAYIAHAILQSLGEKMENVDHFTTVHNYLNFEDSIMRKGAVSARSGERLIIPMNMRDGSLLCRGKGNGEWNFSAPHGAGRIMSRGQAKRQISLSAYEESMEGIYTTCVNQGTLDESPMAYKPMEEIVNNIGDTVEIVDIVKPVYNFKAGGE
jgi:tRNA-splicing ligase RtcB